MQRDCRRDCRKTRRDQMSWPTSKGDLVRYVWTRGMGGKRGDAPSTHSHACSVHAARTGHGQGAGPGTRRHHARSTEMHNTVVAVVLSLLMAVAVVPVAAQVAGSTTIGVSPDEVKTLTRGWSAKK